MQKNKIPSELVSFVFAVASIAVNSCSLIMYYNPKIPKNAYKG